MKFSGRVEVEELTPRVRPTLDDRESSVLELLDDPRGAFFALLGGSDVVDPLAALLEMIGVDVRTWERFEEFDSGLSGESMHDQH